MHRPRSASGIDLFCFPNTGLHGTQELGTVHVIDSMALLAIATLQLTAVSVKHHLTAIAKDQGRSAFAYSFCTAALAGMASTLPRP